jgi:hypothetical protein
MPVAAAAAQEGLTELARAPQEAEHVLCSSLLSSRDAGPAAARRDRFRVKAAACTIRHTPFRRARERAKGHMPELGGSGS